MDGEVPSMPSDSASAEFVDAECGDSSDFYEHAENDNAEEQQRSIISVMRQELEAVKVTDHKSEEITPQPSQSEDSKKDSAQFSETSSSTSKNKEPNTSTESLNQVSDSDSKENYMQNSNWKNQLKHVFILSEAGKPIYSLHGNEDKLATLFGVIQALVSFVQHSQDAITSIHAQGIKFVFIVRNSLILVAASRTKMCVPQIQIQLSDVYNQILSTLTYSQMNKIFEKRKNFDLRRLLAGSERLIQHLLTNESSSEKVTNNVFTFLTNSIRVMPLSSSVRSNIVSAIQSNCSKIKNLVFAVLIANNQLIALVRMKKYSIHPTDLRLIFNLIERSESFKNSENWTPICLPKFDMNGFLHAHVSYLAEDCQACLLLLTVDPDGFFPLSEAKKRITEKLRRTRCLEAISDELNKRTHGKIDLLTLGLFEMRHFLYKPKGLSQILYSDLAPPYDTVDTFKHLEGIYCELLHRTHHSTRPLKLIYEVKEYEIVLAWITTGYELYVIFEPFVDKAGVIDHVNKLLKWIEKEYDVLFIKSHPNF